MGMFTGFTLIRNQRDPRRDPRPGDIVRVGSLTATVVALVTNQIVKYRIDTEESTCWLTDWIAWAKTGETIHVAS